MIGVEITPEFAPLLRQQGLESFDEVMALPGGTVMRSVPGRATVRVQIGSQVAYLKRYQPPYYSWWQRLLYRDNEARREWEMIHALRVHGFHTAPAIAIGQQGNSSFLLTAEIPGGVPADKLLPTVTGAGRERLLRRIAELTQRFHETGFIHKDYYLSHIFVAGEDLYLIDLQRVCGPGKFSDRWRVKDLAALAYTLQLAGASDAELFEWTRDTRVRARVAALHARGPKYDVIWDRPGARP